MPAFATLMLFAWVPITAIIFTRFSPERAVVIALLSGYLLLPPKVGLDFPLAPTLNKNTVSLLATVAFYFLALKRKKKIERVNRRRSRTVKGVVATEKTENGIPTDQHSTLTLKVIAGALVLSCFLTYFSNRTPDINGVVFLPGMSLYDCLSYVQSSILLILPLFVARHALLHQDMGIFLLKSVAVAGLLYSLPVLFEARMSPQLNRWVYGFFAHDWIQHIRGGHFRPIVFLNHGLLVGIFLSLATAAVATLCRCDPSHKTRGFWWFALPYMIVALYLSRNTGAFALTVIAVPTIIILPARFQIWAAAALSAIVLLYPMARGADLIPVNKIVTQFEHIDKNRAHSLAFRLKHEDILLERANLKMLNGWGTFGRNRVYDPETGRDLSVTDGIWIITVGTRGWVGYVSLFALLCLPPILLALRRKAVTRVEAGLSIMLVMNLIDFIPNDSMVTHVWILAAALWARLADKPNSLSTEITSARSSSARHQRASRARRII